jgi:hypothetical protein
LEDNAIADAVTPCLLHPYDIIKDDEKADFLGLLQAYDSVIPWAKGDSLGGRIDDVNSVVYGSPQRVRKWALNALTGAKAIGLEKLTWKSFWERKPTKAESDEAKIEFGLRQEYLSYQEDGLPGQSGCDHGQQAGEPSDKDQSNGGQLEKKKVKRRRNPGRCKPKRNVVGEEAA